MNDNKKEELLKEIGDLKAKILKHPYWLTGSVIETTRKQGKTVKPFNYLSQSINGKTKTTYISSKQLPAFKKAVIEGEKLKETISKIGSLHIQLLKMEATDVV